MINLLLTHADNLQFFKSLHSDFIKKLILITYISSDNIQFNYESLKFKTQKCI